MNQLLLPDVIEQGKAGEREPVLSNLPRFLDLVGQSIYEAKDNLFNFENASVSSFVGDFSRLLVDDELMPLIPESIRKDIINAVPSRRSEFIAGRYCAAKSLLRLENVPNVLVTRKHDRSPNWPSNTVGSISHTGHIAVAVTGVESRVKAIGIDVEKIMPLKQANKVSDIVYAGSPPSDLNIELALQTTLLFSAKETLFKALYPIHNKFMEFNHANCVDWDLIDNRCRLKLNDSFNFPEKYFDIDFNFNEHYVFTRLIY